jgi:hypothetical protein
VAKWLYFCGVKFALAFSEPSFFSPAASVMANSCCCEVGLTKPPAPSDSMIEGQRRIRSIRSCCRRALGVW